MKKSKLLTTLMAFALVIGLGACDEVENTDSGETNSSETSGSTNTGSTSGPTTSTTEPLTPGQGDKGNGVYQTSEKGITYKGDDYYATLEADDTPVEHHWASTGTIYEADQRYHVLECQDEGCNETKIEVHQVKVDSDDATTGSCTVCDATELNVDGLSYYLYNDNKEYLISSYDDSWFSYGLDDEDEDIMATTIDLYIPCEYNELPVTGIGNINGTRSTSPFDSCYALGFIAIPNTVTYIASYGFYNMRYLVKCDIPDSVKSIGSYAFQACAFLESINIPYGMTTIEEHTFTSCSSVTEVVIPSTVTSIGDDAFHFCRGLKSVSLPHTLTSIGEQVFMDSGLTSVVLPKGVTEIPTRAFMECYDLESVIIYEKTTFIGWAAFSDCELFECITLPSGLDLDTIALSDCDSLKSIRLPEGLTTIKERLLQRSDSLESVVIPASVTSVEQYAFWNDTALANLFFEGTSEQWDAISFDPTQNTALNDATVYFYSETELEGAWHFVDDVPTLY